MTTPWVPPYFGSWEQLVQELLHNPFLGSGRGPGHPLLEMARMSQRNEVSDGINNAVFQTGRITGFLVSQVSLKELASNLPPDQAGDFTSRIDQAINDEIDDVCGTQAGHHWPYPGPPPWALQIASELNMVANGMREGNLRTDVTKLAGRIVQRAVTGVTTQVTSKKIEKKAA
jgi:hypothetical protein